MDILLHRYDLRTDDNLALERAEEPVPVFILDPEWLQNDKVSDSRIEFVLRSLKDLNRQYVEKGSHLVLRHGRTVDVLRELEQESENIFFNANPNHFRQQQEKKLRQRYSPVYSTPAVRGIARENWNEKVENWIRDSFYGSPETLPSPCIESDTSLDSIRQEYGIEKTKQGFEEAGTEAARRKLESFADRIDSYSSSISEPLKAEKNTSHLSPYIRYGCISVREVFQRIKEESKDQSTEMFLDRILWHQHFRKKIENNPDLFREAINPVYRDLHRENRDEDLVKAWKNGRTGYPLVDASMRALVRTGWLNFRMRAMCASFFSYILKQWWKIGADYFYHHLIDADVAINYYQWQMQSGLVGVHANRIYDPTRQVKENDPGGSFIRKYVPELRNIPDRYIAEPWKMPEETQQKCGTVIGEDYPGLS